jgi:hypothetical protein
MVDRPLVEGREDFYPDITTIQSVFGLKASVDQELLFKTALHKHCIIVFHRKTSANSVRKVQSAVQHFQVDLNFLWCLQL